MEYLIADKEGIRRQLRGARVVLEGYNPNSVLPLRVRIVTLRSLRGGGRHRRVVGDIIWLAPEDLIPVAGIDKGSLEGMSQEQS